MRERLRQKRVWIPLLIVAFVGLLVATNLLLVWQINGESGTFSMAPALPPCNGQVLAEGITYHFRDPHRGEIVFFHASGAIGGTIVPDPNSRDLQVNKRVIGLPGETVVGRGDRVYVDGRRRTTSRRSPFPPSSSHQSSTSSWGTIAASRTTAATPVPFHGQRSTLEQSSTSGRSHTSGCRSTTKTICRQGVCAAGELGLTSKAPTPTFGAAKYFADAMSDENVELFYRAVDAFNRPDLDAYLALMDADVEFVPRQGAMEGESSYRRHDGVRRWWNSLFDVFPDYTIEVVEVHDLGDLTFATIRLRGHGSGSAAPTDQATWIMVRWRGGKCVWWRTFDVRAEALEAVGLSE